MPRTLLDEIFCQSLLEENKALHKANDALQDRIEELEEARDLESAPYEVELEFEGNIVLRTDVVHFEEVMSKMHVVATAIGK